MKTLDEETGEILTHYDRPHPYSSFDAATRPRTREYNSRPSETIPDQTMSVSEIVARYQQGIPLPESKDRVPEYSDEEMPDFDRMDLSEIHEIIQDNQRIIRDIQTEQNTAYAAAAKKKQYDEFTAQYEADKKMDQTNQYPKKTPPEASESPSPTAKDA